MSRFLGSIITNKQNPKDIDFLVVVEDDADLEPLARLGRKIKGRTQQMNRGADIFLTDAQSRYIGRTCSWRECRPGIRSSCDALNCGKRPHLHDDLKTVSLSDETVRSALELYYCWDTGSQFWLFTVYDKDEMADLTSAQRKALKEMIKNLRQGEIDEDISQSQGEACP